MSPSTVGAWISVPQAVFLLASGDLPRARELAEADPGLLVVRVALLFSSKIAIVPLDAGATEAQQVEAWQTARRNLAAVPLGTDSYGAVLAVLEDTLAEGRARAKGSKMPDGPIQPIDPAEFARLHLVGVHAAHKRTKAIVWYDVLVSAGDLLEFRRSLGAAGTAFETAELGPLSRADTRGAAPASAGNVVAIVTYRTGLPGRPTSKHLIEAEFRLRWSTSHKGKKIAEWSHELLAWLKSEHPNAMQPTPKTVINLLRPIRRQLASK
jgi:hypothetical protein